MSNKVALFLGAGFSKWAVGLPTASELFDFDVEIWGLRDQKKYNIVKELKDQWDKENPSTHAEEFIAWVLSSQMIHRTATMWYIGRRLSEPFIWREFHSQKWRRHVLMIDENRKYEVNGVYDARKFLLRHFKPNLAGIITTNYDLVVEYALGTKLFNYGISNQVLVGRGPYPVSQWRNPVMLTGKIPLAKIHGSISWDENAYYTDGRRAITGNALIVAPTPQKQPPASLQNVWSLANRILESCEKLVVFGFAFNPYDEAVLNLLSTSGNALKSVLLINIDPSSTRTTQLWPKAAIEVLSPPKKSTS